MLTSIPWHIITCEYPPQFGGVSDYTRMVATGLAAAGDEVHVWSPALTALNGDSERRNEPVENAAGPIVHRELGQFARADLHHAGSLLDQFVGPKRLFVQWVPHGYGYRSMNLQFCYWLKNRAAKHGDSVELMVHEPYLAFGEGSWKQAGVAAVHRLMTRLLMKAATRVWISIPAWEERLRPYAMGRQISFRWLPVMSNVDIVSDPVSVQAIRARYANNGNQIVGHFGTYDLNIAGRLATSIPLLLAENSGCDILLLGRGSEAMRNALLASHPQLAERIHASGTLSSRELSMHLKTCDVLMQPYVDGVSSRRTSVMAGLSHGVPVVTTKGKFTEPIWSESDAVMLTRVDDTAALVRQTAGLLSDESERRRLGDAGALLYREHFSLENTINTLRAAVS